MDMDQFMCATLFPQPLVYTINPNNTNINVIGIFYFD